MKLRSLSSSAVKVIEKCFEKFNENCNENFLETCNESFIEKVKKKPTDIRLRKSEGYLKLMLPNCYFTGFLGKVKKEKASRDWLRSPEAFISSSNASQVYNSRMISDCKCLICC